MRYVIALLLSCSALFAQNQTNLWQGMSLYQGMQLTTTPSAAVAGGFNPTNGMTHFLSYLDINTNNAPVTSWTDEVAGVVLRASSANAPTNTPLGVHWTATTQRLTNAPFVVDSNSSVWIRFINTNANASYIAFFTESTAGGDGIWLYASKLAALWNGSVSNAGAMSPNVWIDLIWTNNVFFTNGVKMSGGVGWPETNRLINNIGCQLTSGYNIPGYIKYVGIASTNWSSAYMASLLNWAATNSP